VSKQKTKRPPEARPAPPAVNLDMEEENAPQQPDEEKVLLFTLNGTEYFMKPPHANLMLKVLWRARTDGMLVAVSEMLIQLMGEEAYRALMEYEDLTDTELRKVTDRVMHYSTGRMDSILGNF
jgi:hypothetical protein